MAYVEYFFPGQIKLQVICNNCLQRWRLNQFFYFLKPPLPSDFLVQIDFKKKMFSARSISDEDPNISFRFSLDFLPRISIANIKYITMALIWFIYFKKKIVAIHGILALSEFHTPIVISGSSGTGKSTALLKLIKKKFKWQTDDFALIGDGVLMGVPLPITLRHNSYNFIKKNRKPIEYISHLVSKLVFFCSNGKISLLLPIASLPKPHRSITKDKQGNILFLQKSNANSLEIISAEKMAYMLMQNWANSTNPCLSFLEKILNEIEGYELPQFFNKNEKLLQAYLTNHQLWHANTKQYIDDADLGRLYE